MNSLPVTMVRVYLTEPTKHANHIMAYLTHELQLRGATLFRGIAGYGESGAHSASLIDLAMDLPTVIEFFDEPAKVAIALDYLATLVKPEHIVYWNAFSNA